MKAIYGLFRILINCIRFGIFLCIASAQANDFSGIDDVTMQVIGADELPDDVFEVIHIPLKQPGLNTNLADKNNRARSINYSTNQQSIIVDTRPPQLISEPLDPQGVFVTEPVIDSNITNDPNLGLPTDIDPTTGQPIGIEPNLIEPIRGEVGNIDTGIIDPSTGQIPPPTNNTTSPNR